MLDADSTQPQTDADEMLGKYFDSKTKKELKAAELAKESLALSLNTIARALEVRLSNLIEGGQDPAQFLKMLARFADAIDAGAAGSVDRDPRELETAFNGVIALLNTRPIGDEKDFAKEMIGALQKRYQI